MSESQLFSIGVDRLLQAVRPYGQAWTCYPAGLDANEARRTDNESLHDWFVRMVDFYCQGEPLLVAIEENLAVFASLGWEERHRLRYANVQVVWASRDLETYYLRDVDERDDAFFLRMVLEFRSLGPPSSHPLAHIHVEGGNSPRFALDGGQSGNILVDFLEFLYRTYLPAQWMGWVRREWTQARKQADIDESEDPLPAIEAAFAAGQFEMLRSHQEDLEHIKKVLRQRKDSAFGCHMAGEDRLLLEYPAAR